MPYYRSFFSPAPAFLDGTAMGSFLAGCADSTPELVTNAIIATSASLIRIIIAVHARNQAWILMLPIGARGKERSHSA